jgi:hypothetical protein
MGWGLNMKLIKTQFILIITLSFLSLFQGASFALPDDEIQRMVKISPTFKHAEDRIVYIWANLTKQQKKELKEEQIYWINVLRDEEANALMKKGHTFFEAYTIVTNDRSDYLLNVTGQSNQISTPNLDPIPNLESDPESEPESDLESIPETEPIFPDTEPIFPETEPIFPEEDSYN